MSDGIAIAGGGLAAQRAAETLRRAGYAGRVRMICAEPHLPYDRPPLSKEVLSGERADDAVQFRPPDWYKDHDIDLLLGANATSLLPGERLLGLSDGSSVRYDRLLIATGSRPLRLRLLGRFENVHELRTLDDARHLREALGPGARLAVIGAGFVGMEVAATARKLGVEVTIIEAAPAPLAGVLGERLGGWFAELHRAEGVEVLTGRSVTDAWGTRRVQWLELSDSTLVETDHVLVAVGARPDVAWLARSGISNGGVHVDIDGRTAIQEVFAAGDAAATRDPQSGRRVAGSHWEAAGRQAVRAARAMLGLEPGEVELASFWTDQYGLRIQYLGDAPLADAITIDGETEGRDFVASYTRMGRPVAALLVNRPRSLPEIRRRIKIGTVT